MENAYKGKFFERYPCTRAAGILTKAPGNTVETCLKIPEKNLIYFIERGKDAICKAVDQPEIRIDRGKRDDSQSELSQLLKSHDLSPFQSLAKELRESVYASYWQAPLGRRRFLPQSPSCMNPEALTHGLDSPPKIPAGDIINPRKSHAQVLYESEIGKECYKKSHDAYDPGEQVRKNYDCINFPCMRFGIGSPHYDDGRIMRRVLSWMNDDPVSCVSVRQADFVERNKAHLGRGRPFEHCQGRTVPEDRKFGICLKTEPGVSQCLGGGSECSPKNEQLMSLKYINSLRVLLKKRQFTFANLLCSLRDLDQNHSGQLPIATIDSVCRSYKIFINKPIIKFLEILGIMDDKQYVDLCKFVDLLNWQHYFPTLPKVDESNEREVDYNTIHSLSMTGEKEDTSGIRPAGRPSAPLNLPYPRTRRETRADKGNLEGETDIYAVLSPSIFSTYGLSHRDFLKPRCPGELEKIFSGIGVKLPSDAFNEIWEEGYCLDQTGGVCVETFRNLLQKHAAKNLLST